jgi:hypothetical protein
MRERKCKRAVTAVMQINQIHEGVIIQSINPQQLCDMSQFLMAGDE